MTTELNRQATAESYRIIEILPLCDICPSYHMAKFNVDCPFSYATPAFFESENLTLDPAAVFPSAVIPIRSLSSNRVAIEQVYTLYSATDKAVILLGARAHKKLFL